MFHYTNRKGVTYYLHGHTGRGGSVRYTLKRDREGALPELPPGYEVVENVNGQVSARQIRPRKITDEEEAIVLSGLAQHGLDTWQIEVKGNDLTIFEPDTELLNSASDFNPLKDLPGDIGNRLEAMAREQFGDDAVNDYLRERQSQLRKSLEEAMRYEAVMRFRLVAPKRREFEVARMTYSGHGGWYPLDFTSLEEGVKKFVPHLGKDSFFELV